MALPRGCRRVVLPRRLGAGDAAGRGSERADAKDVAGQVAVGPAGAAGEAAECPADTAGRPEVDDTTDGTDAWAGDGHGDEGERRGRDAEWGRVAGPGRRAGVGVVSDPGRPHVVGLVRDSRVGAPP